MAVTYCSIDDVKDKAGTNVPGLTDAQITNFINQAEALINNIMQADLISTYAGFDDSKKLILEDACSSKAAMDAVKWQITNYGSANEAQTILNVLLTTWSEYKTLLKDRDVVAFIQS